MEFERIGKLDVENLPDSIVNLFLNTLREYGYDWVWLGKILVIISEKEAWKEVGKETIFNR